MEQILRTEAEAFLLLLFASSTKWCHSDRSEAKWRNTLLNHRLHPQKSTEILDTPDNLKSGRKNRSPAHSRAFSF
jgi:hypothetical protein